MVQCAEPPAKSCDGPNPVAGARIPKRTLDKAETFAYSPENVQNMLAVMPEPARTLILTASLTGCDVRNSKVYAGRIITMDRRG
jgi:hypothetical protein